MADILYTTTDAIRDAVGVSGSREITDTMLSNQGLETQMQTYLYSWLPTHATVYSEGTTGTPTADQVYKKDLLVMWCLFFGCVRIIEMVMATRQRVSDGKSELERFEVDWQDLLETYKARLAEVQGLLEGEITPTYTATTMFLRVTPDYDPVADE